MKKKVILAYSGGLDTSVLVKWLTNQGFEVICFIADVGQKDDFKALKEKALKTGATKVYVENLQEEFVTDFIFPALRGNAIYEGRYLLGTAIARPLIAKKQIEIAKLENAEYVGHGATAKGNDQVRFELTYYALNPNIKIISPWKDPKFLSEFKGRNDLINYAKKWNIPTNVTKKKPYSEDENLMHISHEAGILEDPTCRPPENIFTLTKSPKEAPYEETIIEIQFQNGNPISVFNKITGILKDKPLELFKYLNELGYENGIGRIDIVENRFVGVKSRGVYETPGATILWAAHRDIEGITMDRDVMHLRDMLIPKFAELIYYGFWYSPEMDFIMSAFNKSQEAIDGKVTLALYKGNINIIGRESQLSLYNEELSSMEGEGGFDAIDSKGFININSIRLKTHNIALKKRNPYQWRRG